MPHNPDFMPAILANPADDYPRIQYGQWLQEQGDPRGEFILLQCRDLREMVFQDKERFWSLRGRELQLQQDHWWAWLDDDLGDIKEEWKLIGYSVKPEDWDWDNPPGSGFLSASFTFDRGFVSTLRIKLGEGLVEALRENQTCFDAFERIIKHPLISQVRFDCDLATGAKVWQLLRQEKPAVALS